MITRRTRRGIILLSLLAILTWVLSRGRSEVGTDSISKLDTRLNYALHDFNAFLLDEQGRINLEMHSPVLRNNAETGIGSVDSPEIQIQQEVERWYITAESAIVTANREHVSLMGKVKLKRRNQLSGQILEIETRDVMLNVTPRTASTESKVRMSQEGDRLEAVGMRIDMVANRFEMLDEVRAHYEIP